MSQPERSAVQVGGAFRMPKVQEVLSEFFGDKKLRTTLNGEEAAALGALLPSLVHWLWLCPGPESGHMYY